MTPQQPVANYCGPGVTLSDYNGNVNVNNTLGNSNSVQFHILLCVKLVKYSGSSNNFKKESYILGKKSIWIATGRN